MATDKATTDVDTLIETQRLYEQFQSQQKVADYLGISRRTVRDRLDAASELDPMYDGRVHVFHQSVIDPPKSGVRRFVLTTAQNNTLVHQQFWDNLVAYAEYIRAEMFISRFSYNHNAFGKLATKPGTEKKQGDLWYDPQIGEYVNDDSVEIAPGLVWCGEMNILPTAVRPLSGFETYTGRKSGIFPHVKVTMESIASGKYEPTKFNYTTGTVTKRNYIQKKAGLKAEFHHTYGALVVEVDSDGDWFVRQLIADESGTFYDLDCKVEKGQITEGHRVEGITWGDVHAEMIDPDVREVSWGEGGIMDTLRPRYQFLHDLLDFRRRNHHDTRDPHKQFAKHVQGRETVEGEMQITADFVRKTAFRKWCETVVVDSNHDNAFMRWLREADYRADPPNARYFLEWQLRVYHAIENGELDFHLVEEALRAKGVQKSVRFLRQDEGFIICRDRGGIECGMHGDLGPNGSRGTPNNLKRLGRRANTGHTHAAGIYDGLYVAGLSAILDQGYNVGPSNWSHSHIVTYANGKRAIITVWNRKWRGEE